MTIRPIVFALVVVILTGCDAMDTMKEGFAHSSAVSAELEKRLGLNSFVGFSWNNGTLRSVTVTFEGIPDQANRENISEEARRAIVAEFKQSPKQVVIAFSIQP